LQRGGDLGRSPELQEKVCFIARGWDPVTSNPLVALIEDEPLVRVPLARMLGDAGFVVVAAATGPEGLSMLDDPRVDVAVVDIRLPGRMDGVAVAREAQRRNPGLKMILTSGAPPDEDVAAIGAFLPKPFRVEQLIDLIRSLVEPKPPGTPRG
jgi:CheY-like chemotaxis protein